MGCTAGAAGEVVRRRRHRHSGRRRGPAGVPAQPRPGWPRRVTATLVAAVVAASVCTTQLHLQRLSNLQPRPRPLSLLLPVAAESTASVSLAAYDDRYGLVRPCTAPLRPAPAGGHGASASAATDWAGAFAQAQACLRVSLGRVQALPTRSDRRAARAELWFELGRVAASALALPASPGTGSMPDGATGSVSAVHVDADRSVVAEAMANAVRANPGHVEAATALSFELVTAGDYEAAAQALQATLDHFQVALAGTAVSESPLAGASTGASRSLLPRGQHVVLLGALGDALSHARRHDAAAARLLEALALHQQGTVTQRAIAIDSSEPPAPRSAIAPRNGSERHARTALSLAQRATWELAACGPTQAMRAVRLLEPLVTPLDAEAHVALARAMFVASASASEPEPDSESQHMPASASQIQSAAASDATDSPGVRNQDLRRRALGAFDAAVQLNPALSGDPRVVCEVLLGALDGTQDCTKALQAQPMWRQRAMRASASETFAGAAASVSVGGGVVGVPAGAMHGTSGQPVAPGSHASGGLHPRTGGSLQLECAAVDLAGLMRRRFDVAAKVLAARMWAAYHHLRGQADHRGDDDARTFNGTASAGSGSGSSSAGDASQPVTLQPDSGGPDSQFTSPASPPCGSARVRRLPPWVARLYKDHVCVLNGGWEAASSLQRRDKTGVDAFTSGYETLLHSIDERGFDSDPRERVPVACAADGDGDEGGAGGRRGGADGTGEVAGVDLCGVGQQGRRACALLQGAHRVAAAAVAGVPAPEALRVHSTSPAAVAGAMVVPASAFWHRDGVASLLPRPGPHLLRSMPRQWEADAMLLEYVRWQLGVEGGGGADDVRLLVHFPLPVPDAGARSGSGHTESVDGAREAARATAPLPSAPPAMRGANAATSDAMRRVVARVEQAGFTTIATRRLPLHNQAPLHFVATLYWGTPVPVVAKTRLCFPGVDLDGRATKGVPFVEVALLQAAPRAAHVHGDRGGDDDDHRRTPKGAHGGAARAQQWASLSAQAAPLKTELRAMLGSHHAIHVTETRDDTFRVAAAVFHGWHGGGHAVETGHDHSGGDGDGGGPAAQPLGWMAIAPFPLPPLAATALRAMQSLVPVVAPPTRRTGSRGGASGAPGVTATGADLSSAAAAELKCAHGVGASALTGPGVIGGHTREHVALVSSVVLSVLGVPRAMSAGSDSDVDYMPAPAFASAAADEGALAAGRGASGSTAGPLGTSFDDHSRSQLRHYAPLTPADVVYDPRLHMWVHGVKVATPAVVLHAKRARGEPKDVADVAALLRHLALRVPDAEAGAPLLPREYQ